VRCLVYCLLICTTASQVRAQDYHFVNYPFAPELGDIKSNVIHLGTDEMIYVGTEAGLLAFDGLRFHKIPVSTRADVAVHVTAITTYRDSIWIGTEDGSVYAGTPDGLTRCKQRGSRPITGLVHSAHRTVFAATYGHGLVHPCDSLADNLSGQLRSQDIYTICTGDPDDIWIGTDAGISILHSGHPDHFKSLGAAQGIRDEIIMSMCRTQDGLVWAGSFEQGICSIDSALQIHYPITPWTYGPVNAMTAVGNGELWLATENKGVFRFDRSQQQISAVGLPGNGAPVIVSMTTDKEGNLWMLDAYRGLYRTNRRIETYPMELQSIQALLIDHTGQFFAGHANGLYALRGSTLKPELIRGGINVVSLYEDDLHNLWVGTFGQGLFCKPHGSSDWYAYRKENGLTDESILSITGVHDTLWLATLGGVTRIEIEDPLSRYRLNSTNYNLADGLGTNFIYTAFADAKGRIWFGTDGNGLSVLEAGSIRNFQKLDTLELHSVYSICEDAQGMIWFVTDRDGIFRYDGAGFIMKELPRGLQDHEISNVVADPLGHILLAHASGVDLLTAEGHVITYRSNASEPFYPNLNAHFRDASSAIWIAGQERLLKYHPLTHAQRNTPLSKLLHVSVFLSPVNFSESHTFNANQNYLTFDFIGLWYTEPTDVTYRYRLEGLDPTWNETRERAVTYQNLSPGQYRFVLESSASGQYTGQDNASFSFRIKKPFYKTVGFLLLSSAGIILLLMFGLRIREAGLRKAAALHRRQIESQLQTLKAQINPHFLFNSFNTLVSVIEEDPRSAVEYVENLSDFYRSILQYREKNLIPLSEEIEIVNSYAYVLQRRYGDALCIELEPLPTDVWIVPLVLQILIENAVKHNVISEPTPLIVRIRKYDDASLIVENTLQKRSAMSESTGFGLQSIKTRYALLTRKPVVVGQRDQTFYVIIPFLSSDEISDH